MYMCIHTLYILRWAMLWVITRFYGDVSDVVLQAPLWTDLYRGCIVGLLWYPGCGWCGWCFNHDGWVKWGYHDIATWLTQANTSAGYKDVFLTSRYIFTYVYYFYLYLYTYMCTWFFKENTGGLLSHFGPTSLRR